MSVVLVVLKQHSQIYLGSMLILFNSKPYLISYRINKDTSIHVYVEALNFHKIENVIWKLFQKN